MKIKVLRGSIKQGDTFYREGQTLEVSEAEANSFFREGIAVEFEEAKQPEKKKDEKKVGNAKTKKEEIKKEEIKLSEPSEDWTYKELEDYAKSINLEVGDDWNKERLWEELQKQKGGEPK